MAANGLQGDFNMISVITDNYGLLELNTLSATQRFENLTKYLGKFFVENFLKEKKRYIC